MKNNELIIAAALPENVGGKVNKTEIQDGKDNFIGHLNLTYPTVAFFESFPEDIKLRAIQLLAAKTLQHEASQQLRAGYNREIAIKRGDKNKKGELLKPLAWSRDFDLATWLLSYVPGEAKEASEDKVIRERGEAMFTMLQTADEATLAKVLKAAKGLKVDWPTTAEGITPAHCRNYQAAKMADLV